MVVVLANYSSQDVSVWNKYIEVAIISSSPSVITAIDDLGSLKQNIQTN
jgi:hypothetical protein